MERIFAYKWKPDIFALFSKYFKLKWWDKRSGGGREKEREQKRDVEESLWDTASAYHDNIVANVTYAIVFKRYTEEASYRWTRWCSGGRGGRTERNDNEADAEAAPERCVSLARRIVSPAGNVRSINLHLRSYARNRDRFARAFAAVYALTRRNDKMHSSHPLSIFLSLFISFSLSTHTAACKKLYEPTYIPDHAIITAFVRDVP